MIIIIVTIRDNNHFKYIKGDFMKIRLFLAVASLAGLGGEMLALSRPLSRRPGNSAEFMLEEQLYTAVEQGNKDALQRLLPQAYSPDIHFDREVDQLIGNMIMTAPEGDRERYNDMAKIILDYNRRQPRPFSILYNIVLRNHMDEARRLIQDFGESPNQGGGIASPLAAVVRGGFAGSNADRLALAQMLVELGGDPSFGHYPGEVMRQVERAESIARSPEDKETYRAIGRLYNGVIAQKNVVRRQLPQTGLPSALAQEIAEY